MQGSFLADALYSIKSNNHSQMFEVIKGKETLTIS